MPKVERRLAAILAADVVGYSRMMSQDETGTLRRVKALFAELIRPKIAEHGGRIVKTMGDGVLADFRSAFDAFQSAVDIQEGVSARNQQDQVWQPLKMRIGINIGDIIFDQDDVFGDGVNIAARLEGLAKPGGICVSARAWEDLRKLQLGFEDLGEQQLKNIAQPVRVYSLVPLEEEKVVTARVQPFKKPRLLSPNRLIAGSILAVLFIAAVAGFAIIGQEPTPAADAEEPAVAGSPGASGARNRPLVPDTSSSIFIRRAVPKRGNKPLRLRRGPSPQAEEVAIIGTDEVFRVAPRNGNWWPARLADGREGFVSNEWVRVLDEDDAD